MPDHILAYAKAYAALIGAILTAVISSSTTPLPAWVGVVAAVCTAVATYAVPNKPRLSRSDRAAVAEFAAKSARVLDKPVTVTIDKSSLRDMQRMVDEMRKRRP
jgi:uncharacterized protein GlcG (DUF336 family)